MSSQYGRGKGGASRFSQMTGKGGTLRRAGLAQGAPCGGWWRWGAEGRDARPICTEEWRGEGGGGGGTAGAQLEEVGVEEDHGPEARLDLRTKHSARAQGTPASVPASATPACGARASDAARLAGVELLGLDVLADVKDGVHHHPLVHLSKTGCITTHLLPCREEREGACGACPVGTPVTRSPRGASSLLGSGTPATRLAPQRVVGSGVRGEGRGVSD